MSMKDVIKEINNLKSDSNRWKFEEVSSNWLPNIKTRTVKALLPCDLEQRSRLY